MAFSVTSEQTDGIAKLTLTGELDAASAGEFRGAVEAAAEENPEHLVLIMDDLTFMASAGLRVLVFAKQKMPTEVDLYIVGAHDAVKETITMTGFHYSCTMLDTYDADAIGAA